MAAAHGQHLLPNLVWTYGDYAGSIFHLGEAGVGIEPTVANAIADPSIDMGSFAHLRLPATTPPPEQES
ncbi:MAG TPA: hypothetical protein VEW66_00265 [Thermomicrobiales bacterium]|nr:hypothetical protein [Thermomicrobiales bacterium]